MFTNFKRQMQESFASLIKNQTNLFVTETDRDRIWDTYLNGFLDSDIRQEHNCNCCRSFIKNYGNIVAIIGGKLHTLWEFIPESEYEPSVKALNALISSSPIRDVFISDTSRIGTDSNVQRYESSGVPFDPFAAPIKLVPLETPITWQHMCLDLPKEFVNKNPLSRESVMGTFRDNRNVFKRSLDSITQDSLEIVLELISQNSLYRGQEHEFVLKEFLKIKKEYTKTQEKDNYCWINSSKIPVAVAKIRNSAIGTLLTAISDGEELDKAVTAFEKMVAPTNYKRPNAIVTKGMVNEAEKKIEELGLKESLERRFATPEDITVDHLLFVNRDAKKALGVFEEMKEEVEINPKTLSKLEEVTMDNFLNDILPKAKSVEVLFENSHLNNLVSVITAKNLESPSMFKWNNPFSWSYTNAVTDSIKEQVKAAGGKIDGELRVSLSWFNYDDLDLHVIQPGGQEIWFSNKIDSTTSGHLDVDMNAGGGHTRKAVENTVWTNKSKMREGLYTVRVNNFSKREQIDIGFIVEIECQGEIFTFEHSKDVRMKEMVNVAEFTYSKTTGIKFKSSIKSTTVSKEKWGLSTNKFCKVSMLMKSPNQWEHPVGNEHVFFILEGAHNDEVPRGFFNEFLKEDLLKNKRVFEVLGGKLKVEPADKQLSGLGFSSTQKTPLICRVGGKFSRLIKIN